MCCLKAFELTAIANRDQFFQKQGHHFNGIYLRGQTEIDSAYMGGLRKVDFIRIFGIMLFHYSMMDEQFRRIVGNEFCPYFEFDKLWFSGMEIGKPDCIFQFPERGFNRPPAVI